MTDSDTLYSNLAYVAAVATSAKLTKDLLDGTAPNDVFDPTAKATMDAWMNDPTVADLLFRLRNTFNTRPWPKDCKWDDIRAIAKLPSALECQHSSVLRKVECRSGAEGEDSDYTGNTDDGQC